MKAAGITKVHRPENHPMGLGPRSGPADGGSTVLFHAPGAQATPPALTNSWRGGLRFWNGFDYSQAQPLLRLPS